MNGKRRRKAKCALESLETRCLMAVIYVDINANAGSPDGHSWQSAYGDLQQALGIAGSGDQIHVADGTYKPTSTTDRTATFQLKDGVTILGGYAGFGAANPDARDTVNTPTILSGDIGTVGSNADNSYNVVTGNGTDLTAVLDGMTITGGAADGTGDSDSYNGGGITILAGSPTINNCVITANSATPAGGFALFNHGGGLYVDGASSPKISNCIFSNNTLAGGNGGGIYDAGSSATYINCLITGNTSNLAAGMWIEQGSGSLINCTVANNTATGTCGGLTTEGGTEAFTSCIIYGNTGASFPDFRSLSTTANITYSDIGGGYTGTGNINVNPFFVNPAGANFQLQSISLCIGAGNPAALPSGDTTDLAGNPRVAFGIVDTGAYESTVRRTLYVDLNATGANTGASWTDAFTDLDPALAGATSGTQILVAQGTYDHDFTYNSSATYALRDGILVYGGYQGGSSNPFARDIAAFRTILDGQASQSMHIVTVEAGTGSGAVLDGFEIANAQAYSFSDTDHEADGGGILILNATLTINDCSFVDDFVSAPTGGPTYGGAVFIDSTSHSTITNCSFSGCSADVGGAVGINGGSATISNCTFTNNQADYDGGAIGSGSNTGISITNCTFIGNSANLAGANGGGAIVFLGGGQIDTVTNCIFSANSTNGYGGGILDFSSDTLSLINDSFSTNTANIGGAVAGGTSMVNCILWGDSAPTQYPEYGGPTATYCDIAGGIVSGTGNISSDPFFVNAAQGNLHLASNSPCIDVGSNAAVTASTDLAGNSRILNNTVDMGAYEFVPSLTVKSGTYFYDAARPTVEMVFSGPLLAGSVVSSGSLILTNTTTDSTINTTFDTETIYNPGVYIADWLFDNVLPDGDYTAEIKAGSVTDAQGNPLSADFSFNFFVLGGDANHDGVVNVADLVAAAQNWQKTGKTFSQGDFNYDGNVDLADLRILAANWGKTSTGLSQAPLLSPLLTMLALPATADPASSEPQQSATDTEVASDPVVAPASVIPASKPALKKPVVSHTSSISGSVFNDRNRDGKRKGKDAGLAGWRVFIDSNNDGILDDGETSVLTDAKGNWKISGLAAGTYSVRIVPGKRWTVTTSNGPSLKVKLAAGAKVDHKLFGVFHLA